MHTAIEQAGGGEATQVTRRTLYWMALAASVLGGLYLAGLVGKLIVNGSVHAVSSPGVQLVTASIAIAWDVVLLVLFAALRREYSGSRPLFAELALMFMLLVCATSTINWFVQLAVVPRLTVEAGGRTLVDVHNEASMPYAMEHLGWGLFYGLAALFAAAAIGGSGLEGWIRWLLVASGILSLLHFVGVIAGSPLLGDLGYVAWGVLLPLSTALLAVRFRAST